MFENVFEKTFAMAMRDGDDGEEMTARDVEPAPTHPHTCRQGVAVQKFEHAM